MEQQWFDIQYPRTDFDDYIEKHYYESVWCPGDFICLNIDRILHREWWRSVRHMLNDEQKSGLYNEMIETLSRKSIGGIHWDHTVCIEEAFTVDLIPEFKTVARDWKNQR